MSLAITCAWMSSTLSGLTMTRISRPACMAKTFSTPSRAAAICSILVSRCVNRCAASRRAPGRPPLIASAAWVSTASTVRVSTSL